MKTLNFSSLLCFSLVLGACSSYRAPESIESKMARYESKEKLENNIQIEAIQYKYRGRSIASTPDDQMKERYYSKLSHRSVYFLTLHNQYRELASFLPQEVSQVEICPAFHTALVDTPPTSFTHKNINYQKLALAPHALENAALYPELSLSVNDGVQFNSLQNILTQEPYKKSQFGEILLSAVELHLSQIRQELETLCQSGQSANYHIYENLLTYYGEKISAQKDSETMKMLLKTNLFVNTALINSLQQYQKQGGRSIASDEYSIEDTGVVLHKESLRRLGAEWTEDYFKTIYTKRRSLGNN